MYNDIKKCKMCGKLFKPIRSNVCNDCLDKKEEDYKVVRDYIYDNHEAGVIKIEKETGIPAKHILEFIKDGRISLATGNSFLKCTNCGVSISEGEYCSKCKSKLINELELIENSYSEAIPKEDVSFDPSTNSAGMHIKYNK